jgi:hypothetical protein
MRLLAALRRREKLRLRLQDSIAFAQGELDRAAQSPGAGDASGDQVCTDCQSGTPMA